MIVFLAGLALFAFAGTSAAKVAVVDTTYTSWPNTVYYFFGRNNVPNQVLGPNAPYTDVKIHITAVDRYTLYVNGTQLGTDDKWQTVETYTLTGSFSDLNIAVKVENFGLGNGNGLMVDIEAGPDRFGTSTVKRNARLVTINNKPSMVEYPSRWYYFTGDIETVYKKDWYNFDKTLFDNATKLGFKWVMLGKMGNIHYLPDNHVEIVSGYDGNVDSGTPLNGGLTLRKIDGEDIALKKPAQEERLVDGDLTQGYAYAMDPLNTSRWIDLEKMYRVNKLVIYSGDSNPQNWTTYSVKGFSAEISLDSFRYEEVGIIHDIGVTNKDNGGYNYAEVSFPAEMARYVRYNIKESRLSPPNLGEIMVYGTGYAYDAEYISPWINCGSATAMKNFDKIVWTGDVPNGTSIKLQTQTRYTLSDGGVVTSTWSEDNSAKTFKFASPEPATEFRYKVRLATGNVDLTPTFKSMKVSYSKTDQPLAAAKSSIFPNAVPMGADTSFVYKLDYTLAAGTPSQNIKKIVISVPNFARADSVVLAGTKKSLPFTSYSTNDSLYVTLNDSLTKTPDILRVYLKTSLLKSLHVFQSEIYNSRGNDNAGGVKVWENTDESWSVKTTTVMENMLADVKALPKAFTPNGDGINDFTVVEFTLAKVEAPVKVKIFSTDGTLVRVLFDGKLSARDYRVPNKTGGLKAGTAGDAKKLPGYWDGKNKDGDLVPPGIYFYQVIADTDEGVKVKSGTVAVAY